MKEYTGLLSYSPSAHERLIVLAGVAFVGFSFLLGEKIFSGHRVEEHGHEHAPAVAHEAVAEKA